MVATELHKLAMGVDKTGKAQHLPEEVQARVLTAAMDIIQQQIRGTYSAIYTDAMVASRTALYDVIYHKMHRDGTANGEKGKGVRYSQATIEIDGQEVSLRDYAKTELAEILQVVAKTKDLSDYASIFPELAIIQAGKESMNGIVEEISKQNIDPVRAVPTDRVDAFQVPRDIQRFDKSSLNHVEQQQSAYPQANLISALKDKFAEVPGRKVDFEAGARAYNLAPVNAELLSKNGVFGLKPVPPVVDRPEEEVVAAPSV